GYPKFASFPGFGADIGFVYEYRPHVDKYRYEMDGKKGLWRRDQNKYKLKAGFSVLDIGGIRFRQAKLSQDLQIDADGILFRQIKTGDYPVFDFDSILHKYGTRLSSESTYKVALPTALSTQIDYNIWRTFYVNFTGYLALQNR